MNNYYNKDYFNMPQNDTEDQSYETLRNLTISQSSFLDVSLSPINTTIDSFMEMSIQPRTSQYHPEYQSINQSNEPRNRSTLGYHSLSSNLEYWPSNFDMDQTREYRLFTDQSEERLYELFPATSSPREQYFNEAYSANTSLFSSHAPSTIQGSCTNVNKSNMSFGARTSKSPVRYSTPTPKYTEKPVKESEIPKTKLCTFCRKNNERPSVYLSHTIREKVGSKKIVSCPILRSYVCPSCKESGDNAHTIAYCPKLKRNGKFNMQSVTVALKNSRVLSKGTRRY